MRTTSLVAMAVRFTLIVTLCAVPAVIAAQQQSAPAAAGATYAPPRTPDGQPNISGIYQAISAPGPVEVANTVAPPRQGGGSRAGSEFSFGINERVAAGGERRPLIVDPADGKIPFQPWALEKRKEIIANQDKVEYLDGRVLCLPPGLPRTQMPAPVVGYQIMQKPGAVVIFYEQSHLYRVIPIDNRPPLHSNIRKSLGVSRGRWEGNTLVVEATQFTTTLANHNWVIAISSATTGVAGENMTSGHGSIHSDALRVVERFTPIDADTIRYEATIHDPKVYTQPWTVRYDAMKRAPADYVPIEYACHEGNERNIELLVNVDTTGVRVRVP